MPTQLGLFDLREGERRRDEGKALVEKNEQERNLQFMETMRKFAIHTAIVNGSVTIDDVREYASVCGLEPHHPNVWGSVFKGKGWEMSGWTKSKVPEAHARVNRVWKWIGQ